MKALEVMDQNEDRTWNSETHTTAGHLLSVIKSFEFIANLPKSSFIYQTHHSEIAED